MGTIWVALGVVYSKSKGIFICKRTELQHQGGKWEFPGGKVESGEHAIDALHRELSEEIGIEVKKANPLLVLEHNYPERTVKLDVWLVREYQGVPKSLEGLEHCWVPVDKLTEYEFPEANQPIIKALQAIL